MAWSLSTAAAVISKGKKEAEADSNDDLYEHILEEDTIGEPGMDPAPFMPVPRSITAVKYMPPEIRKAWIKAFVKELKGVIIDRQAFEMFDPLPSDKVIPISDVHRCKISQDGTIEKLKSRVVFRGDLYEPEEKMDTWNPHASFLSLKVFLATCARFKVRPVQTDFLLAYLQSDMRERVFVRFPANWADFVPNHLKKWIGRPLLLKKALYGYNFSGKFLYLDQAEFLVKQGLEETALPGLWVKHLRNGGALLFLHYVDDILTACTNDKSHKEFLTALSSRFDVETKAVADWYLQTRIQQDKEFNITLDQRRYCLSMLHRFLPNFANVPPTDVEKNKYAAPLRHDAVLSKDDCSKTREDVNALEEEYGFRFIELIGSFNWLAYTCYEEIFAIRRLCRYMDKPGRPHFQAALHLLHHFRCHPPKPLIFYSDVRDSPVYRLVREVPGFLDKFDPSYFVFADSAHGDSDERRSTACDLQVYQGGLIDHISWVPKPVPLSTAESENNCYSAAIMRMRYTKKAICHILFMDEDAPLTVPILVDSTAAIAMNESDTPTRRTRHVESRYWYGRRSVQAGHAAMVKVDGKTQQPADVGTKNMRDRESIYCRGPFESPHMPN